MKIKDFLLQFIDRDVLKRLSFYVIPAWLIIQAAVNIFDPLKFPSWMTPAVIIACFIGFPAYFVYTLYWNKKIDEYGKDFKFQFDWKLPIYKFLTFYIIAAIPIFYLLVSNYLDSPEFIQKEIIRGRITVAIFDNQTYQNEYNIIGEAIAERISDGLQELEHADVARPSLGPSNFDNMYIVEAGLNMFSRIAEVTQAENVVTGRYYLENDSTLTFKSEIRKLSNGELLYDFDTVNTPVTKQMQGIYDLRNEVVGFWASKEDKVITGNPPQFDAYTEYLKAVSSWNDNDEHSSAKKHLENCIQRDADFYRAKLLYIALLRNINNYSKADSLRLELENNKEKLSKNEKNSLLFFRNDLTGRKIDAYQSYKKEYELDKKNYFSNISMSTYALNYAQKPKEALSILKEIKNSNLDYSNCKYCRQKFQIEARSYFWLDKIKKAKKTLYKYAEVGNNDDEFHQLYAKLLIESGDSSEIEKYYELFVNNSYDKKQKLTNLMREAYLVYDTLRLNQFIAEYDQISHSNTKSIDYWELRRNQYQEDYSTALRNVDNILKNNNHVYYIAKKGIFEQKLGNSETADSIKNHLLNKSDVYSFGYYKYLASRIELAKNNKEKALELLKESIKEGLTFRKDFFQNDPELRDLFDHPDFIDLVKAKG